MRWVTVLLRQCGQLESANMVDAGQIQRKTTQPDLSPERGARSGPRLAELSAAAHFGVLYTFGRGRVRRSETSASSPCGLTAPYRTGRLPGRINRALSTRSSGERTGVHIAHVAGVLAKAASPHHRRSYPNR